MNDPPFPFLVGRGRSGTTLVRAMFDSHPEMAVVDESHFLVWLGRSRRRYESDRGLRIEPFLRDLTRHVGFRRSWLELEGEVRRSFADMPPANCPDAIRHLYRLYAASRGKTRYGDKTPIHVLHLDLLAELFPEARFVHVIRDGRNASLSYMGLPFGPSSLWEAALHWKRYVIAGRKAGRRLGPGRYREVRYEELVDRPEGIVRELCEFVGLTFDTSMLNYFERADQIVGKVAHYQNVHLPPTQGLRDWRREMSRRDVAIFEALVGDLLTELGYERAIDRLPPDIKARAQLRTLGVQMERAGRHARKLVRRTRQGLVRGLERMESRTAVAVRTRDDRRPSTLGVPARDERGGVE
ncbi:MAG: sulfotransferase family protein [Actinomycetota bacterium]